MLILPNWVPYLLQICSASSCEAVPEKIFAEGWVKVLPAVMASYQLLKDAGASAIVFPDRAPNNVLNATDPDFGARLLVLPGAQIGMEDWQLIRRSLEKIRETIAEDEESLAR